ncbi:MAG: DUF4160 domain-containing protein [Beijerinckiaceae bacterium]|nr:DUF4160 domain-containing protein [Beijerinckiaceae bacterium]
MAAVLRFDGLRVVIYPNDDRPANVHVKGKGCEAVFLLHCPEGPPELRESYGFGRVDLRRIEGRLDEALMQLRGEWERRHGDH